MDFSSDVITIEVDGHVATVWLDRPEQRNAFNLAMWDDLPRAMKALGDDDTIRVVVIAARGPAFTVGIDLKELGPALVTGDIDGESEPASDAVRAKRIYEMVKRFQRTMSSPAECPKPVIAAVHGWCLGAGMDLITACDIRLSAADAVFSIRETKMAMVADVGTLQRLPSVIAPGHVAELAFTGNDIDAEHAQEIGLINAVYADADSVVKAAQELAHEIADNSPLAVQGSKGVLRAGEGRSIDEALDYVALWNAAFLRSNDLDEAVQAFIEKRPTHFTGE